jgi:ribosome assembly protein YihI (activator of Der GTPase)
MTRIKKSRKPGAGSSGKMRLSKEKLRELREMKEHRNKKHSGNKAGTRNAQDTKKATDDKRSQNQHDARKGSKKPISLVPEAKMVATPEEVKFNRNLKPMASLDHSKRELLTPQQELESIENDQKLMSLLERQNAGETLVGKDAKYLNSKVARHQALCEILGITDEDDYEDEDMYDDEDMLDQFMSSDLADEWLDDEEDEGEWK